MNIFTFHSLQTDLILKGLLNLQFADQCPMSPDSQPSSLPQLFSESPHSQYHLQACLKSSPKVSKSPMPPHSQPTVQEACLTHIQPASTLFEKSQFPWFSPFSSIRFRHSKFTVCTTTDQYRYQCFQGVAKKSLKTKIKYK